MDEWGRLPQFDNAHVIVFVRENLIKSIVFYLSPENRGDALAFGVEEVPASIDILATICEHYQISPRIPPRTIRKWLETYRTLAYEFGENDYEEGSRFFNEINQRRVVVEATFARLEQIAKQYPDP